MKTLTLCAAFIKKNIIPIIITFITLTVSLFMLVTIIGKYSYQTYTYDILKTSGLQNSVYGMPNRIGDQYANIENSSLIQNKVTGMKGVSSIITYQSTLIEYNEYPCNLFLYSGVLRNNIKLSLSEGEWFSEHPQETEAVIGGIIWNDVQIGDYLTLENGITAKVVGIIGDSVVYPSFTRSTNAEFTSDYLFDETDNTIFITEETIESAYLDENIYRTPNNFFVVFDNDISNADKENVITYLESQGKVRTYDEICASTENSLRNWIKEQFPLPVFLIIIATINIICICAVLIKRSMPDMAKYYMMGCSKNKSIGIIIMSLTGIFTLPAIINIVLAGYFPNFIRQEINSKRVDYIIGLNKQYSMCQTL